MRSSGVLMHLSSLPSPYGIGTMGKQAKQFVDFLEKAGQTYWQMLPICPTSYGDSPYQSPSGFAGNPYFIDLDILCTKKLLKKSECRSYQWNVKDDTVDYALLYKNRYDLLRKAKVRFFENVPQEYGPVSYTHLDVYKRQLLSGKKILLAEDNDINRDIAKELLELQGATVIACEDGKQALQAFQNSGIREYDAILLDIRMPVLDGYETAGRIRALNRKDAVIIPMIAVTAHAFSGDVTAALRAGMNAHVSKPLDIAELCDKPVSYTHLDVYKRQGYIRYQGL